MPYNVYPKLSAMGKIIMLIKAISKGKYLRTIIPIGIVIKFNLSEGENVSWEIRAKRWRAYNYYEII
jgi:hypothetical protein